MACPIEGSMPNKVSTLTQSVDPKLGGKGPLVTLEELIDPSTPLIVSVIVEFKSPRANPSLAIT